MLRESESFSNLADEVAYQKTMAALLTLAAAASAAYMQPIVGARGAVSRASPVNMQMQKKVISFDQDGLFEGRELSIPVRSQPRAPRAQSPRPASPCTRL